MDFRLLGHWLEVSGPSCACMPSIWNSADVWRDALAQPGEAFGVLGNLLQTLCVKLEAVKGPLPFAASVVDWVADACSLIVAVLEGLARDAWVLPSNSSMGVKRKMPARKEPMCQGDEVEKLADLVRCAMLEPGCSKPAGGGLELQLVSWPGGMRGAIK